MGAVRGGVDGGVDRTHAALRESSSARPAAGSSRAREGAVRVRFPEAESWDLTGAVRFPARAPPTYTPTTLITEWLTLNCVGDWAAHRRRGWIEVRFSRAEDAEDARRHFTASGLWK